MAPYTFMLAGLAAPGFASNPLLIYIGDLPLNSKFLLIFLNNISISC